MAPASESMDENKYFVGFDHSYEGFLLYIFHV